MRLSLIFNIFYYIYNRMSKWVNHVKEFSKQKGISYGEAMKNEECKKTYNSSKKDIIIEEPISKPLKPVKTTTTPKLPKKEVVEEVIQEVVQEIPKKTKSSKKSKII